MARSGARTLPAMSPPPNARQTNLMPPPARPAARRPRPRAGDALQPGSSFLEVVEVAVAADTDLLTYGLPTHGHGAVAGCRVSVPVRGRLEVGVIWRRMAASECQVAVEKLRPIASLLDEEALWPEALRGALAQLARYTHSRLGMVVRTALPGPLRRTGAEHDRAPGRLPWHAELVPAVDWPVGLKRAQRRVLERLLAIGPCEVSALRRDVDPTTGIAKAVAVPQSALVELEQAGLLRLSQQREQLDPFAGATVPAPDVAPPLSADQQRAVSAIGGAVRERRYQGFLLRGVTGSGKTEVYLAAIAEALSGGRSAIVLVPEIALTPQLVERFQARFGDRVVALHSGMTDRARLAALEHLRRHGSVVAIGPRSTLFAPLADVGAIILDECHDASFKQATGVRYHARDLALLLGRGHGAAVVLGSATPACEEWQLAATDRLQLVELPARVLQRRLPEAFVIDLRVAERLQDPGDDRPSLLSRPLVDAIAETVGRGEQAIVLHNRRGFAPTLICRGCGAALECPRCTVTLVLHQAQRRLRCHLCDYAAPVEQPCVHCHATARLQVGAGTERIEQALQRELPSARIGRFDRDTAQGLRLHDLLDRFRRRELDVLVGTQMLSKGHDFPAVTLVGVVLAEAGLDIPDFRAGERTFQLLTQVAGRAGRGERPGRVLVQTFRPDHPAIVSALAQDHDAFLANELTLRRRAHYPPFGHLALLEVRHADASRAEAGLLSLVEALRQDGADVRGPLPAGISRIRDVWRLQALLRDDDRSALHHRLQWIAARAPQALPSGVTLLLDVDPLDFG